MSVLGWLGERRLRFLALASALASLLVSSLGAPASAAPRDETVLLIRPAPSARPTLLEAFNRLQGELRMHGFEMRVVETTQPPSSTMLERQADQGQAVAAVAFVEQGETTRVDIWMSDRVTGKTIKRTIEPGSDRLAGSLLAVRALELLRASLREYGELEAEAEDLPGAHPERADVAVRTLGRPTPRELRWGVGVGVAGAGSLPRGAFSFGPELSAECRGGSWALRVTSLGPAWGGHYGTAQSRFDYRWFGVVVEPRWRLTGERLELGLFPSLGAIRWDVSGTASDPFRGRTDVAWTALVGVGAELGVSLRPVSETAWLYFSARSVAAAPSARVHLGEERVRLGAPLLVFGAGLRVLF